MCSSKSRVHQGIKLATTIAKINGRPVLQPKSNQVPGLERRNSLKKNSPNQESPFPQPVLFPLPTSNNNASNKTKPPSYSPPISPKLKSPRTPALKRGNDPNVLNSSGEKILTPRCASKAATSTITTTTTAVAKKSKKLSAASAETFSAVGVKCPASLSEEAPPGRIAAARREQVATMQKQRKLRIAHYGRTQSAKFESKAAAAAADYTLTTTPVFARDEKRCSFITPNSDPIYVAYHDEEWGVAVHDDKLLFELLMLTGAQVGSDWSSVLKKRQAFREAFSGFDAQVVAKFTEKKITSISAEYGIETCQVRGVVDNSIRILQVKKEVGSFDKYLWGFVNYKPICTQYKSCNKIPVKTSKSETISKDMVKRGFRLVGPTVIHSFMQAAGLTNDHLTTCPRHLQCIALASQQHPTASPEDIAKRE